MALNHYITLGRSGLRVSPLALGTMTFGLDWGFGTDPTTSKRILDAYLDRGGNFIDTANIYTKGHSEKIIGDHLGSHPGKRHRAVIATKFMGNLYPGDPNAGGAHRKGIYQQLENSLRRLQTDYVDLYWMHFEDPHTPIEETMRALDDLVHAGKVRYIGFSDTPAWKCVQAQMIANLRDWTPLIAIQIEYSLLERTVEGALIPMALEMGMGVTPWSPLKGGILSGKHTRESVAASLAGTATKIGRSEHNARRFDDRAWAVCDALASISRQCHATPGQIALAWVQSRLGVSSTIIGARTLDQLAENIKALDVSLMPEHMATLDQLTRPTFHFPFDFLKSMRAVHQGGSHINGEPSDLWPLGPKTDAERH
ncbi:MAG: aldo/keto reductase [Phycisphaerales bacterium]